MKIQSIPRLLSGCLVWLGLSAVAFQQTAVAQYTRPDGPTLRQLAEAPGIPHRRELSQLAPIQTREPGGHDLTDDQYFSSMRDNIRRFTDLGLEVWITEMSVDVDPTKPLDEQLERQAEVYRRVFKVCLENPGMKGIKLWGILDNVDRSSGQQLHPYLFDAEGRAKPAFFAVQQALAEKSTDKSR